MKKRLPDQFAWVKISREAGQDLPAIFRRKNFERKSGRGKYRNTFWWGIGESRVDAVRHLVDAVHHLGSEPKVLFSETQKTRPENNGVRLWRKWKYWNEEELRDIPDHVIVTSKMTSRSWHCALVCRSKGRIENSGAGFEEVKENEELRNILKTGASGKDRGHTTRVVKRMSVPGAGKPKLHKIISFLDLEDPYCVLLKKSRELTGEEFDCLQSVSRPGTRMKEWRQAVTEIRSAN